MKKSPGILNLLLAKSAGSDTSLPAQGGIGAEGNPGMVNTAESTPYSIAYIGISFKSATTDAGLGKAMLKNRSGKYILANEKTVSAAVEATSANTPDDERISLILALGGESYPIINSGAERFARGCVRAGYGSVTGPIPDLRSGSAAGDPKRHSVGARDIGRRGGTTALYGWVVELSVERAADAFARLLFDLCRVAIHQEDLPYGPLARLCGGFSCDEFCPGDACHLPLRLWRRPALASAPPAKTRA